MHNYPTRCMCACWSTWSFIFGFMSVLSHQKRGGSDPSTSHQLAAPLDRNMCAMYGPHCCFPAGTVAGAEILELLFTMSAGLTYHPRHGVAGGSSLAPSPIRLKA